MKLNDRIAAVLTKFPDVEAAYLFGSRANGSAKSTSDIDLALVVKQPLGMTKLDILASLTANGIDNIDLITLDVDDVVLRFEAIHQNKLIFARESFDRGGYFSRIVREYFDFLPYLKVQREATKRRLERG